MNPQEDPPWPSKRRLAWIAAALTLVVVATALLVWYLHASVPRRVVFATGPEESIDHAYALRYAQILARNGIAVEVRPTEGSQASASLLHDPNSGVDVAIVSGGANAPTSQTKLVMLAALYYEPLWVFYNGQETLGDLHALRGKRIAVGTAQSGVHAFAEALLAANGLDAENSRFYRRGNLDAVRALRDKEVDAALMLGSAEAPAIAQALRDPNLKLMNLEAAEAYPRRFTNIAKLTLPPGTVDLGLRIPPREVKLIGTKAMLVARDDLSPTIVHLLIDAAREVHMQQGYFEAIGEFPNVMPVDLPVSEEAARHLRYGPTMFERRLPSVLATYVERLIIVLVPLLVILVPVFNVLPSLYSSFVRSRIHQWYGALKLLERAIDEHVGPPPIERWLADLDRIEAAATRIRIPASFASEAYTLREHIDFVRRTAAAKGEEADRASVDRGARERSANS